MHGSNDEQPLDYTWNDHGYGGDCVYRLCAHVLEKLQVGETYENTAVDYLSNLKIVEPVYLSDAKGRRIDLDV